ncbi:lipase family protein [Embleya sp. NPDC056575]|uniref:lipase family protein n=1 Tax=unclassified Embleya TaxID=2699296 RepID=UPI0036773AE1
MCVGVLLACSGAVPAASAAGGNGTGGDGTGRGTLLSHHVERLTRAEVRDVLKAEQLPETDARHPIDVHRVRYRTIDPQGRPTVASGVVAIPRGAPRAQRVVVYEHGTTVERAGAPSGSNAHDNLTYPLYFASAGHFTVAPDYLGLGSGPGFHPYEHAASEATASLDLIRAARRLADRAHLRLDERVLVTGFSQGGHAAMALARSLDGGADPHLRLGALAPVAGPYDFDGVMRPAALAYQGKETNLSLAYLMLAWGPIYGLYRNPAEVFRADQVENVTNLFAGKLPDKDVLDRLPDTLEGLFRAEFVARLQQPDDALAAALRANDATCSWTPSVPVVLFGGAADHTVPFANTENCARRLTERAASVRVVNVGPVDHFASRRLAIPQVLAGFARQA